MLAPLPNKWAARLRDAILDNSALRDGLTDEEAQPLIDWGLAVAVRVTADLSSRTPNEADVRYEELYEALPKLLTRITWVTLFREKKGAEWTVKTLNQLNELNRTLYGESAPQFSDLQISTYANRYDGLERGALVKALMSILSPNTDELSQT
jgi:hypothetical protein